MPGSPTVAVAVNPVEHSQSPFIHAEFARQTGQALDYGRLLCPLAAFAATLRAFAADRSAGAVRGCNVTVPFKFEAFALAARRRARCARIVTTRCASTRGRRRLAGRQHRRHRPRARHRSQRRRGPGGKRVLLIGRGRRGADALGPLLEARPAVVLVVANRTVAKAENWSRAMPIWPAAAHWRCPRAARTGERFDVVINATASSLQGAQVPVDSAVLAPGALALDMMYGPAAQGFIAWAQAHGARGRDGLGMLVEQAAEAFFLWRGVRPETAPVLAALRARLAREVR